MPLCARSSSHTNPWTQNQSGAFGQVFRERAVALLDLPPLSEFESFLPKRFGLTADSANTFQRPEISVPSQARSAGAPNQISGNGVLPQVHEMFIWPNRLCVNGVLPHVHEMFSFPSKLLSLVARILEFRSLRFVGADIVLFRMNMVSRPNSAENKSYDVKREVGETVLPKVPMKRGPLSGDANFADLESWR